jgi:phenylacetate-coenzyme A ligase PaaK-like adenylate-forming protein
MLPGWTFWRDRLSKIDTDESKIDSLSDLARFPILAKEDLRTIRPAALLPEGSRRHLAVCRWTSGVTGRPTVNFWTAADWAALVSSTARMLARHQPTRSPTVFNGYSHAHVTGPLYNQALQQLGGTVYDRSHHAEEVFPTSTQAQLFDFDTLVLPERTTRGKSIGLADLLEVDPSILARHRVLWWIGSSGTFCAETIAVAREQGVQAVSNLYGSSEFGLFAISCTDIPGDYHVAQGHVLVEVVNESGEQVEDGQFGRIVVTHLAGMGEDGHARTHTGTQLLRLAAGDGATYLSRACTCGLTTSRLRDVQRVQTRG